MVVRGKESVAKLAIFLLLSLVTLFFDNIHLLHFSRLDMMPMIMQGKKTCFEYELFESLDQNEQCRWPFRVFDDG